MKNVPYLMVFHGFKNSRPVLLKYRFMYDKTEENLLYHYDVVNKNGYYCNNKRYHLFKIKYKTLCDKDNYTVIDG